MSSDDEVTPVAKLSFVPALNLTEVKKKRDETGGKKEEKKGGLFGTCPIPSPLNQWITDWAVRWARTTGLINSTTNKLRMSIAQRGSATQSASSANAQDETSYDSNAAAAKVPPPDAQQHKNSEELSFSEDSLGYYDVDQSFKGFLSNLERRMNTEDPKLQLLLGNPHAEEAARVPTNNEIF